MTDSQNLQLIKDLQARLESARRELQEFIYVEDVLVAARIVSKDKIEKAHELVQTLQLAQGKPDKP